MDKMSVVYDASREVGPRTGRASAFLPRASVSLDTSINHFVFFLSIYNYNYGGRCVGFSIWPAA